MQSGSFLPLKQGIVALLLPQTFGVCESLRFCGAARCSGDDKRVPFFCVGMMFFCEILIFRVLLDVVNSMYELLG